jgi:hypothetical protein
MVQGKAKVGAVIGGFVHGAVKLRATRHDSGGGDSSHVKLIERFGASVLSGSFSQKLEQKNLI